MATADRERAAEIAEAGLGRLAEAAMAGGRRTSAAAVAHAAEPTPTTYGPRPALVLTPPRPETRDEQLDRIAREIVERHGDVLEALRYC